MEEQVGSEFTLHAKMYAVAVKYGMAHLEQKAKSRFRALLSKAWDPLRLSRFHPSCLQSDSRIERRSPRSRGELQG